MKVYLTALAAGLTIGGSACGATPTAAVAAFQVGGVDFKLSLPAGYCLPVGQIAEAAKTAAAADSANVTDLTTEKCDSAGMSPDEPLLIKTPRSVLSTNVERPALLSEMGAEFDKPDIAAALASGEIDKSSAEAFSKVVGDPVTVKSDLKPVGKDDTCAYLAGTEAIGEASGSTVVAVAACMTAVRKRVLSIYAYGPYSGPQSVVALAPKAKALALTLIKENE